MDYSLAIDRNRDALLRMVAVWVAMLGGLSGGTVKRQTYFAILRLVRAGESAVRRLVVIRAREMAETTYVKRAGPKGPIPKGTGSSERVPPFALFDPRKTFEARTGRKRPLDPRIGFFDEANAQGRTRLQKALLHRMISLIRRAWADGLPRSWRR